MIALRIEPHMAKARTGRGPMEPKAPTPARVPSADEDCPDCDQEVAQHRA